MSEKEAKVTIDILLPASEERTQEGYEFGLEPDKLVENCLYAIWWEDLPLEVNETEDFFFDAIFPHSMIDFSIPGMKELYDAALALWRKYGSETMSHWDKLLGKLVADGWGIYDSDSRTLFWSPYMGIKDWKEYCEEDEFE